MTSSAEANDCSPSRKEFVALRVPGTDNRDAAVREILDVARNNNLGVNQCSRLDQSLCHAARPLGGQASPFERDAITDWKNPVDVVATQLLQPSRYRCCRSSIGSQLERDPFHDLAKCDDAQINTGRIDRAEPDPSLVIPPACLRQDIGIDKVHQNATSRPRSGDRALIASTTSSGHGGPFKMW